MLSRVFMGSATCGRESSRPLLPRRLGIRFAVAATVIAALTASCTTYDNLMFTPPEGVYVGAACMCTQCWNKPFCFNYGGTSAGQPPGTPQVYESLASQNDKCNDQIHFVHSQVVHPFDPSGAFNTQTRAIAHDSINFLYCVTPEDRGQLIPNVGDTCSTTDILDVTHFNPCLDVPRQCRIGPKYTECEKPDPNGPACPQDALDNILGPFRYACGSTQQTQLVKFPSSAFDQAIDTGTANAERKLAAKSCNAIWPAPTLGAPTRFCYTSCFDVLTKVCADGSGACLEECFLKQLDPPYIPAEAFKLVADPQVSKATMNVVVIDSKDAAVNSYPGTTKVTGEFIFELSKNCHGPLAMNQTETCSLASFTSIVLTSDGSFQVAGKKVEHLRVLLHQPKVVQGVTVGDETTLVIPSGASFGVSTDIEGIAPMNEPGRAGSTFFNSGTMMAKVNWTKRTFTFIGTVFDNQSSLTLALSGSVANQPPRANAGNDQTVECISSGAPVTLSGAGSTDPDGQNNVAGYAWTWPVDLVASGVTLNSLVSLGSTKFSLTVSDYSGAEDIASVRVTSHDTTPPILTLGAPQPECLWAPNHKIVLYELGKQLPFTVKDTCDTNPKVEVVSVTSNQPDLGGGQGDFTPDFIRGKGGLCLRSERQGTVMWDREYTIAVVATDASGNKTPKSVVVRVPHDQAGATKCPKIDSARYVDLTDPRCTEN